MVNNKDSCAYKIKQTLLSVEWIGNLIWKVKAYFIRGHRVKSYRISGIKEYCLKKGHYYNIIGQNGDRNICVPECYEGNKEQIHSYNCAETYIAEIPQPIILKRDMNLSNNAPIIYMEFIL